MAESISMPPTYQYDAFISYSRQDKAWVHGDLLPRLEQAGLTICIDTRDFDIGVPSLVNMENAVQRSRKTLLVLTPDWVASQWTDFEALLIQTKDPVGRGRRMLPLMVRDCELPDRLSIFTYLDLRNPADFDFQIRRLVDEIRGAQQEASAHKPVSLTTPSPPPETGIPKASSGRGFSYERGLARLDELLANADTETMLNFAVLEARLVENLRSEGLYGSTETLRHERAMILHDLNKIALGMGDRSFLDLSG